MGDIETAGKILSRTIRIAAEKILAQFVVPLKREQLEPLVAEQVSLFDIYKLLCVEVATGASANWKPENQAFWNKMQQALAWARQTVVKIPPTTLLPFLTPESALKYLAENRPDLGNIFESPLGYAWLDRQLREFREFLGLPINLPEANPNGTDNEAPTA